MPAIFDLWHRLTGTQRWRVALGLLGLALGAWLILADKPWMFAEGGKIRLRDLVAICSWWAAAVDLLIVGGLFILCPWWARPLGRITASQTPNPRWFWPLVGAAMLVSASFNLPRMNFSFWDDEELSVRTAIAGKFNTKPPREAQFDPVRWEETFFDYRTPNNHVLHSILARLSNEAWRFLSRPQELPFAEWAVRIPAFVFGILAVAALAWFLKDAGLPAAGVAAAFLLALHPWHVRYASEARGYSMVFFLVPFFFVFWRRAVMRGAWKWWSAFALAQLALLYTYPGTLPLQVVLNLLTLPVLAWSSRSAGPFSAQSGRWFCVNALAALPAFLLMAPLLPQAREYFQFESSREIVVGGPWVKGALSYLLAGMPWKGTDMLHPSLEYFGQIHPFYLWVFAGLTFVLLLLGILRFSSLDGAAACVAAAIILTPVLTFLLARARHLLIYESYVSYALPGLIAFVAVGIALAGKAAGRLPAGSMAGPGLAVLLIAGYGLSTWPFRSWLATHPLQQIRESVLACRGTLDPWAPSQASTLTASFCIPPYLYDAHMIRVASVEEFLAVLHRADREKKSLCFNIGMPWAARDYSPQMWALFNDRRLFDPPLQLHGFDPGLDRLVARYRPGSADQFDFSQFDGARR